MRPSIALLLTLGLATLARAQEPLFHYIGAVKCQECHYAPGGPRARDFVLLNEARVWKTRDKHSMAVRLLMGISRTGDEGQLVIEPSKPENAVGLNMLAKLKVLTPEDLQAAKDRASTMDPQLQAAQEAVRANRKKTLEAKLKNLENPDEVTDEQIEELEKVESESEEKVQQIELDYLTPLIDKCYASPIGRGCLACHADLRESGPSPNLESASFRKDSVPDGVSCEACHGPGERYLEPHYKAEFRRTPPKDKIALGLNDLRHPAVRANQCYSCHIGDVQQGKFVEHSWYMAGHPPLPSIEVETFAHDMPRHWRYFKEKKIRDGSQEFVAAVKSDEGHAFEIDSQFPQTKEVVVGGVVALRKSVNLLADAHAKYQDAVIPDFAAFDCQACHQELRTRPILTRDEDRFDPFVPGRPNISRWSFALADLGVDLTKDEKERAAFDAQINDWRTAMSRQPFGDRAKTKAAAEGLQALLTGLATRLAQQETSQETAQAAYDRLKQIATSELLDFHSARQTIWAMQVIATEAKLPLPEDLQYPKGDNVSDVARYLQIRLPAGAKKVITDPDNLPQLLSRIDAYDPEAFRDLMRKKLGAQ